MSSVTELFNNLHHFSLLLSMILLITGFVTSKFPPKKINMLYGYRTKRSMKNQKNWDFAQKFATREMLRGGWVMFGFSLTGLLYQASILVDTVSGTALMTIIFITLITRTELKLKELEQSSA